MWLCLTSNLTAEQETRALRFPYSYRVFSLRFLSTLANSPSSPEGRESREIKTVKITTIKIEIISVGSIEIDYVGQVAIG